MARSFRHIVCTFLDKGWVKAVLIALPVTVFYGFLAVLALSFAGEKLWDVYIAQDNSWHPVFEPVDCVLFWSGLLGLTGIAGAWAAFLFQERWRARVTRLNKAVSFLLLCGVVGAFLLAVFMGKLIVQDTGPWYGYQFLVVLLVYVVIPLCIALYGLCLALAVSHVNWRHLKKGGGS